MNNIDEHIYVHLRVLDNIEKYETSCRLLDVPIDRQLRALVSNVCITIVDRSFGFNEMRAFATSIDMNLESLTLQAAGLTSRSIRVLCQRLKQCVHLHSLVITW
jgi:hypothetical protein